MNKILLNKIRKVGLEAALRAGSELKKIYNQPGKIKFSLKSKHQIVTLADTIAEKVILSSIRKNFPTHDILSEEAGFSDFSSQEYLWVVDPLDGTTNFTMKNPIFSTSLALIYRGRVIYGIIFAPVLSELYVANLNGGAFLNNKKIKVSNEKNLSKSFHTYCYGTRSSVSGGKAIRYYKNMFKKGYEIRQMGAATIEFARVAQGITESIVIPGAHVWDVAAGMLLVKEAGGKVTDFSNQVWSPGSKDIVASNRLIHRQLLKIIHES